MNSVLTLRPLGGSLPKWNHFYRNGPGAHRIHLLKARVANGRWATGMEKAGPVTLTVGEHGFQHEEDGKEFFLFVQHAMPETGYEVLARIVRAKALAVGAEQG